MHLYILMIAVISSVGAQVQPASHIIPEGTESVNGSDVSGGCPVPPSVNRVCGTPGAGTISYLIDDSIPVLNTAAPNWASQLVTVRKNSSTVAIPYDHVLLAFDYNSPVSLILVELNLFYCPEWNIGAPNITVYVDEDGGHFIDGYLEGSPGIAVHGNVVLSSQSSCDSLLPVRIPLENTTTQHHTWYIVVSFDPQPDIEWVHVGEVRLYNLPVPSTYPSTTSSMDTPTIRMITSSRLTPPLSTADKIIPTTTLIAGSRSPVTTSTADSDPSTTILSSNPTSVENNIATIAAGVSGGLVVTLLLALILTAVILIFMYRRRRQYQKVELENLQSVVAEHKHGREHKVQEEYEFENPHYGSVESARCQTCEQPGTYSVNNPIYSTAGRSLSPPVPPSDYAEIGEGKNGTINRMQHNNVDEMLHTYCYIGVAETKQKCPSPVPAPNQSAPEPPVYSDIQKKAPPIVPQKSPQLYTDLQSEKEDQSYSPIYSDVKKEEAPVVPPKSPALEEYLATRDATNHMIINETNGERNAPQKLATLSWPVVGMAQNPNREKCPSPGPAPNQSIPEPPVYSAAQKKASPTVTQKLPQFNADLQSEKEDQSHSPIYSDVKKEEAPVVPQKSPALEEYLAATNRSTPNEINGEMKKTSAPQSPPKLATLSRPVVGMAQNPNYQSSDEFPTLTSHSTDKIDGNVYAEPVLSDGPPITACPLYESIYSEPINPSDFMCGSSPDEGVEPHVYAPVYTVPSAPLKSHLQPFQVTPSNIQEREVLGSGQFGHVILAATKGLSLKDMKLSKADENQKISILVAVKKLKPNAHKGQREAFDKEVKFMSHLKHGNVVRLLGVCSSEPAFIMMEYMEEGDLRQFLQRYSEINNAPASSQTQISTSTLIHMSIQISSAMKYLASLNFVHRDLATRNCLVGQNFVVKLADFGLSRNLNQAQYYRIQGNTILPIRWMATECYYGKFSEKTDVWSFGVTMWELFTLAKQLPYADMKDKEVVADAIKGAQRQLLSRPNVCPEPIYQIMMQCWVTEPEERATFESLHDQLMAMNELSQ